jgi:hypothetical protein
LLAATISSLFLFKPSEPLTAVEGSCSDICEPPP